MRGSARDGPLAAHRSTLRLGTLVSPVTFRHPSELAKVVVVADHVSGRAALAARWADEYNTPFASLEDAVAMKDRVTAACDAAGREPIPFSLMTGVLVGRDRAELRDRARLVAEHRRDLQDPDAFLAATRSTWITGTVDEVAEQFGALRDAGIARVMCQQLLHTDLDQVALIGGELAPMVA